MGQAARTSPINLLCSDNSSFVSIWIQTNHNTHIVYHSSSSYKGLIQEHVEEKAESTHFGFMTRTHYILYPLLLCGKHMPASERLNIHKTINIAFKYFILKIMLFFLKHSIHSNFTLIFDSFVIFWFRPILSRIKHFNNI